MAKLTEYKCPSCGGAMEFDSQSQKMKCPYCDTMLTIEEYNKLAGTEETGHAESGSAAQVQNGAAGDDEGQTPGYWSDSETAGMRIYGCESCGGEIVASETLGAATCPYCGNNVVIKGQFKGDLKPDYIIPFKKDKKQAKEAYYKHLEKKSFLPKVFKDDNHIDEIKGVYVPFWLYDAEAGGEMVYNATRVHTRQTETKTHITTYTTTEFFQLLRDGKAVFTRVPADGSSKMDDDLMDSVEPFAFEDLVPFDAAYMAGYLAERYDQTAQECMERARERITKSAKDSFYQTTSGYATVTPVREDLNVRTTKTKYALLPVWILNTTWQGDHFIFAMNGQNGNLVGNLPCDKKEFWRYVLTRTLCIGTVLMLIQLMALLG